MHIRPRSFALTNIVLVGLLTLGSAASSAQSNRALAVAIDRVPVPPVEQVQIERLGGSLKTPWSIAVLPEGGLLITEKHGGIRVLDRHGRLSFALAGGPSGAYQSEDSGLLDIVLDPDFPSNRLVYVAFVEGTEAANRTAIWTARLEGDRFVGGHVLFRVNQGKKGPNHPGGRLLFLPDRTLLLTVGDGYDYRDKAQDPASHLGKVLRLTRDGVAAPDNPFSQRAGYAPEIWTLGHRNIQGLAIDAVTGTVWSHEHGPRGGDEINRLVAGSNYGWPRASNGIDYDGTLITSIAHAPEFKSPDFMWAPSIAPSGLAIYRGTLYPELDGRLLVGALAARAMVQLRSHPRTRLLAEERRILSGLKQRVRDIRVAPDGNIYLLTDEADGALYRLVPRHTQLEAPGRGDRRSVSDLAFLLGYWNGKSSLWRSGEGKSPPIAEISRTNCEPTLKGTYVQCTSTFSREDGRTRTIFNFMNYDRRRRVFGSRILDSNWGGIGDLAMTADPEGRRWTILTRTTTQLGQPADERITMTISSDGRQLEHREEMRIDGTSDWLRTFQWDWVRTDAQ